MSLFRLAALNGCIYEGSTNPRTGSFYAFVVNTDVVISSLTIVTVTGTTVTTNTQGVTTLNIAATTLKQGVVIMVPQGSYISSITLASGSIILYNI